MIRKINILFLIIATSCNVSVNRKNNSTDIEEAKVFGTKFYSLVKEKKFNDASLFFAGEITAKDGLEIFNKVNNFIGDLDTAIFLNGSSNLDINSNKKEGEFVLNYKTIYAKDSAKEEMVIEIIRDSLKITGYHPRVKI